MKKTINVLIILCGLGWSVNAQDKFTPETLWKLGRVSEPQASPDGKSIVYGVRTFDVVADKGNTDLFIVSVAGGEAKRLTTFKGAEYNPRWRPDGLKIGFLAAESGSAQLWEINPDGTGLRQVSKQPTDISNFNYAPTGNAIYFTQEVQVDKLVKDIYPDLPNAKGRLIDGLMYRHWDTWEDGAYSHVFYANYAEGVLSNATDIMPNEAFDVPLVPNGGEEQLNWSADGKQIAYTCKKLSGTAYATSTNSEIYIYNLETKKTSNITEGILGYDTEPRFSPDGKSIIWLSMERPGFEADRNRLFTYDFATKARKELTTGFDQSVSNPLWSNDGKTIYFESATQATHQFYALSMLSVKGVYPIRKITEGQHDLHNMSIAFDGRTATLVGTRNTISEPAEVIKINISNGLIAQLTYTNKEVLSKVKMGKVEKRMVKATDGKEILTWVIYPPDFNPAKKYPTLLYCQGGPQSVVSQFFSYRWNFQLMAAQGYIVVAPNRRGLPSFGQAWNDQISGDWGGQAMKDLLSAIDDVAKEPYVATDKLGAVGASFGGFAVYWLAGNHNKRFKTFIAHCGVFNLESMYGATEETFFATYDMGGAYWAAPKPKSYDAFSPHKFVQNWDTPMLVIHNERDYRVPLNQGMEAFTAAQLKGVKSKMLIIENEGHWVTKPQNSLLWQRTFLGWLDETLK